MPEIPELRERILVFAFTLLEFSIGLMQERASCKEHGKEPDSIKGTTSSFYCVTLITS